MNTFFTSDQHWGHKNIIKYCERPFDSVEEMDEAMIANWNSVVGKHDEVFHLGDFSFLTRKDALTLRRRLNGNICLLLGNHDLARVPVSSPGFNWVKHYHEIAGKRFGKRIVLNHYPFQTWNGSHRGTYMLHAHCHGAVGNVVNGIPLRRLDVGVDPNSFTPVSVDQVLEYMEAIEIPFQSERKT